MKKKLKLLVFFLLISFMFNISVKAESSIKCSPTDVTVGEQITCNVKTDEPVEVTTKLSLVAGNTTLEKDGNIVYKATTTGTYDVVLSTIDGMSPSFETKVKVNVTEKTTTTTKKTTTTKAKSDNNLLSKILIDGELVEDFDSETTKYEMAVGYDTKKVNVKAIAEDDNAEVEVDSPDSLDVGDNLITITVTSEEGSVKYYKVTINRKEKEASSNTKLKGIKISGYKLDFDSNSKTFYVKIKKNESELDITATPKDKEATVKITGNEDLEDGSIIKVVVTAPDNTKATYRIIIEKTESSPMPFIIIGIIVLVIIGIAIFVVIQNKNNKKNKSKKTKKVVKKDKEESSKNDSEEEEDYDEDDDYEDDEDYDDEEENEKTIKMKTIDNDEEEKTRMLSTTDDDLEKTKVIPSLKDENYDDDDNYEDSFGI